MILAAAIVFWVSAGGIFYAYAGYPVLLEMARRFRPRKVRKGLYEPMVSVLIAAFNEEKYIGRKIQNLLEQDYPADNLEILIGSDGAQDGTDSIVSGIDNPRIRFFRYVTNRGKPNVLNSLMHEARGSIIVFTDARQRFEPDAVRQLVMNFHDPEVGCVSGELFFEKGEGTGAAAGMNAYWKYEKFLRRRESEVHSMLGATGAIYAIRRRLYVPVPPDTLVDDMHIPLSIVRSGFRAVFDASARAWDIPSREGRQEFTRKVRTLTGNFQIFERFGSLFLPWKSPVAFQLFSHKWLRLMVPYMMLFAGVSNVILAGSAFYRWLLAGQIFFYLLAALERLIETKFPGRRGPGAMPYMFCLLNYSAFVALVRYLKKKPVSSAWEKAYA